MASVDMQFEYPVEEWWVGEYAEIPEHIRGGIERYLTELRAPGDFLTAVITNDLRNAFARADEDSLKALRLLNRWFYNRAPSCAHGSHDAMRRWLRAQENDIVSRLFASAENDQLKGRLLREAAEEIRRLQRIVDAFEARGKQILDGLEQHLGG